MSAPVRKLLGQTAIYGISSVIGRLLNYLLVPLYTYHFSTVEYGIVTELYAYVAFFLVVLTFGMETAFFRFAEKYEHKNKIFANAFIFTILTSLLFISIVFIFNDKIVYFLQGGKNIHPYYKYFTLCFALVITFDAISTIPFAKLRQEDRAISFATIKLINIGTNIFFNLFFIVFCSAVYKNTNSFFFNFVHLFYIPEMTVGYIFISNLIATLISFIFLIPFFVKIKFKIDLFLLKKMLIYSAPLLIVGLAGIINENADRIFLKIFLPLPMNEKLSQIGIYGACYKISILMTIFIQAFRYAADPFFFSQEKKHYSKQTYSQVLNLFVIAGTIIFLFVMLNISWIQFFIGKDYRQGIAIVPVLLMANLFLGIFYNLSIWYKLTDKTYFGAYLAIIGACITIIINITAIPYYGYWASTWATFFCYFTMTTLSLLIGRKYYQINYNIKKIVLYILLSLTGYYISTFVENINFAYDYESLIVKNFILILFILTVIKIEKNNVLTFLFKKK